MSKCCYSKKVFVSETNNTLANLPYKIDDIMKIANL